jgi:hypothetical protein
MSSLLSSGISVDMLLPIISSSEYPYRSSAPLFQLVIVPSKVLLKIASSESSTIEANLSNSSFL